MNFLPLVRITGQEGANDTLTVNALGGDDRVDASLLPADLIGLVLNGGAGTDTIFGSQGNDLVNGGPGNDIVELQATGTTRSSGTPATAATQSTGKAAPTGWSSTARTPRKTSISRPTAVSIRLTRDVGGVTMDLGGIETVDLNALGGADTVTVNDLTGTDVSAVNLNLAGVRRAAATARPTPSSSTAPTAPTHPGPALAATARAITAIVNCLAVRGDHRPRRAANDTLTVNALGGNDMVDASLLARRSDRPGPERRRRDRYDLRQPG